MNPKHPMQSLVIDHDGRVRFRKNEIVDFLLTWSSERGMSLNNLASVAFSQEDREQFAQLIGYSVSGFGELCYASEETVKEANEKAKALLAELKLKGAEHD